MVDCRIATSSASASASASIERLVGAIAYDAGTFDEVREALAKAQAERDAMTAELQEQDALLVIAFHPDIVAAYRRQVTQLQVALADSKEALRRSLPCVR